MKIKVNDHVIIRSGKDKNKKGKVMQALPVYNKVVVEGINKMYKHLRSQKRGEQGQKIEFFAPIHISNVALLCPKCNKKTRIGYKTLESKEKKRVCVKCKEIID